MSDQIVLMLITESKLAEGKGYTSLAIAKLVEAQRVLYSPMCADLTPESSCQLLSAVLNNLGCLYRHKGNLRDAVDCLERAYAAELDANNVTTTTMLNLCAACSGHGHHKRAIQLAKCTIQTLESSPSDHEDSGVDSKKAAAYHNLAMETLHVLCASKRHHSLHEIQDVVNMCQRAQLHSTRAFGADSETTHHIRHCLKSASNLLASCKTQQTTHRPLNITHGINHHAERIQKSRANTLHHQAQLLKALPRRLPTIEHGAASSTEGKMSISPSPLPPPGPWPTGSSTYQKRVDSKATGAMVETDSTAPTLTSQKVGTKTPLAPYSIVSGKKKNDVLDLQRASAMKIQREVRRCLARRRVHRLQTRRRMETEATRRGWNAIIIQSLWRGIEARKRVFVIRQEMSIVVRKEMFLPFERNVN